MEKEKAKVEAMLQNPVIIYNWMQALGLTFQAKSLYAMLYGATINGDAVQVRQKLIAQKLHVSVHTVRGSLRELKAKGLVQAVDCFDDFGRAPNRYRAISARRTHE